MIILGELGNKRACQAFSDYLTLNHIEHKVELQDQQFVILVNQDQYSLSHQLFTDFITNPNQAKYLDASWQVSNPDSNLSPSLSSAKSDLGLIKIWQSSGVITRAVTLVCLFIYAFSYFGYFEPIFLALSFNWDFAQPYRLITPMLMHLSTLHIVFNLTWWWYLGGKIEKSLSAFWLINLTLLTALISNVGQATIVSSNFAGLSGVVYGLAGFSWLYGRNRPTQAIQLPNNTFVFLLIWMGLGFVDLLPINMANWAHLFGLIAGLISAQILTVNKR